MIHICLDVANCTHHIGGIGIYVAELGKRLEKDDDLKLTGVFMNIHSAEKENEVLNGFSFEVKKYLFATRGYYLPILKYIPFFHFFKKKRYDICIFPNNIMPHWIREKKILVLYDIIPVHYPNEGWHQYIADNMRFGARQADAIITVSEYSREEIATTFHIARNKIHVVIPGIDENMYMKEYSTDFYQAVKTKYGLPSNYILYIGGVNKRKNIERIVASYKKARTQGLTDKLVLVGHQNAIAEQVSDYLQDEDLRDNIILAGYVTETEKIIFYRLASTFVYLSLYEGFGMPIVEAMASGTPVITSNTTSMPEAAGGAALLVDPSDTSQVAEAFLKLSTDTILRENLISAGYERVKECSWDKAALKFKDIIQSVYEGKNIG